MLHVSNQVKLFKKTYDANECCCHPTAEVQAERLGCSQLSVSALGLMGGLQTKYYLAHNICTLQSYKSKMLKCKACGCCYKEEGAFQHAYMIDT